MAEQAAVVTCQHVCFPCNLHVSYVPHVLVSLRPRTANLGDAATALAPRCVTKPAASPPSAPLTCTTPPPVSLISLFPLDLPCCVPRAQLLSLLLSLHFSQLRASCSLLFPAFGMLSFISLAPCVQVVVPPHDDLLRCPYNGYFGDTFTALVFGSGFSSRLVCAFLRYPCTPSLCLRGPRALSLCTHLTSGLFLLPSYPFVPCPYTS